MCVCVCVCVVRMSQAIEAAAYRLAHVSNSASTPEKEGGGRQERKRVRGGGGSEMAQRQEEAEKHRWEVIRKRIEAKKTTRRWVNNHCVCVCVCVCICVCNMSLLFRSFCVSHISLSLI